MEGFPKREVEQAQKKRSYKKIFLKYLERVHLAHYSDTNSCKNKSIKSIDLFFVF